MKEIKRDQAVIHYTITGSGDITLLLVHGSYMDETCWKEQVNFFSRNYKVVTMDLPGHGRSGKERTNWSVEGFGADVVHLIKELHLENVILIGHSLGGDINLIAATSADLPIIGFIAIDNFKNAATPLPAEFEKQAESILDNLEKNFSKTNEEYAKMVLLTPQTPVEITQLVINDYRNAYRPMGLATMPQIFKLYEVEEELLPKMKWKLYLINVDYMPTNEDPLKKFAGEGYEVKHMKGTCHFPMLENPEELNEKLQSVINEISVEAHA